jgi:hypothetical protein
MRMRDVEFQWSILRACSEKGFASGLIGELQIRWSAMQIAAQEVAKNSSGSDKCAPITRKKKSIRAGRFVDGQRGRKAFEERAGAIEVGTPDMYLTRE